MSEDDLSRPAVTSGAGGGADTSPHDQVIDGRYRVLRRLGGGGMAEVFLAEDATLGRLVAVKVLHTRFADDPEFVARFHREARAAAAISHPNVVAIYDRGGEAGSSYIVMEYVPGETLKQRVRREGRLDPGEATDLVLEVLAALRVAHEYHIVHRDVAAKNVLLDERGGVKVADFGIARIGSSDMTRAGVVLGTCHYLPPEQAAGRAADERSDLYSVGVVLFELLTGALPFDGDSDVVIAMKHRDEAPPAPSSLVAGVPPALDDVVLKALAKDPDGRYQTAAEFAAELRRVRDRLDADAGRSGPAPTPGAAPAPVAPVPAPVAPGREAPPAVAPGREAPPAVAPGWEAPPAVAPGREAPPAVAPGWEAPPAVAPGAVSPPPPAPTVAGDMVATRPVAPGPAAAPAVMAAPETAGVPAPRRRRRGLRVLVVLLLLAVAAAAALAAYRTVDDGTTSVPRVLGAAEAVARSTLRQAGFKVQVRDTYSDDYGNGEVARQKPSPGVDFKDGRTVQLWVSRGPLHVDVPDVVGLKAAEAADLLEKGAVKAVRAGGAANGTPEGQVYKQSPASGSRVERGARVTYWVSTGPATVTVPDVVGLSWLDARDELEAADLVVTVDTTAGFGEVPGDVIAQDPAAGSEVKRGSEIVISVAVF